MIEFTPPIKTIIYGYRSGGCFCSSNQTAISWGKFTLQQSHRSPLCPFPHPHPFTTCSQCHRLPDGQAIDHPGGKRGSPYRVVRVCHSWGDWSDQQTGVPSSVHSFQGGRWWSSRGGNGGCQRDGAEGGTGSIGTGAVWRISWEGNE